jgi:PAS domain S-box-containing protein
VEWRVEPIEELAAPHLLKLYSRALKLFFRHAPGAFWTTDKHLRLTAVVGREGTILGASPETLVGKTIQEFVGNDDPSDPAVARHLAALAGISGSFRYRLRENFFEARVEPLRDPGHRVIGAVGVALNVTEQKRAEDALELSRARLSEAQRLAHVGSFTWYVASNVIECSEELLRILGADLSKPERDFDAFVSRVHPDDVVALREAVSSALVKRGPFALRYRIRRPGGEVRTLESRGDVVLDDRGEVARVTGSCWDVTEPSNSTAALARSAALLQAAIEGTADGLLAVDRYGKIVAHNKRFWELWSVPPTKALPADIQSLIDAIAPQLEDASGFLERIEELRARPDAQSFDVLRLTDGRVFERYTIPQKLDGDVVGRVFSFRDVTDRERLLRRAEFLAESGRLLGSLNVEKALEGVARLSVPYLGDGCAVDLLTDVGGSRRLLVIQRDPDRPMRSDLPRAVLSGRPLVYSVDSASYMSVPLPGRGTLFGVLTFAAGPNRRYGEADLEVAEELARRTALAIENARLFHGAEEALQAREEFLSIAAHEIRGPITSLHLSIQALRAAPPTARSMGRMLDVIERDDRQLIRLVDELLDVTRIRGGRLQFDLERVDLGEVSREVMTRLGPELTRSGSSLSVSTEGDLIGLWDKTRLDQVVTNLVSNAIKYGLGNPIEVIVRGDDERVTLVVGDHGIGIDPKMRDRVFDPFARGVSPRTYGGLGLGLYIVRTIVDGLGGTVTVESTLHVGSTFTVVLPRAKQA